MGAFEDYDNFNIDRQMAEYCLQWLVYCGVEGGLWYSGQRELNESGYWSWLEWPIQFTQFKSILMTLEPS